jgi:general secretion pathway protein J
MHVHPPEALRAFPPLSHCKAMRAGGRCLRCGAALARQPWHGLRQLHGFDVQLQNTMPTPMTSMAGMAFARLTQPYQAAP